MILKDLNKEKLNFKKDIKKNLKKCLLLFVSILIYTMFGGVVFFYVEDCLAYGVNVQHPGLDSNLFCMDICKELSSINHTLSKNNNTTNHVLEVIQNATNLCQQQIIDSLKQQKDSPQTCKLTFDKFEKWSRFSFVVVFTIGYGDIVPKSKLGKIFTMLFALFGIPGAGATLVMFGRLIKNIIQLFIVSIEQNVFKHKQVRYFQKKTITLLILLTLTSLFLYAAGVFLLARHVYAYDLLDWFYFSFITTSTIGFGDITFEYNDLPPMHPLIFLVVAISIFVIIFLTMSTVASVISVLTNLETERSYKKERIKKPKKQKTQETVEK